MNSRFFSIFWPRGKSLRDIRSLALPPGRFARPVLWRPGLQWPWAERRGGGPLEARRCAGREQPWEHTARPRRGAVLRGDSAVGGAWAGGGWELGVSVDVESRTETPEPSGRKGQFSQALTLKLPSSSLWFWPPLPQQTRAADARRRRPRPRPVGLLVSPAQGCPAAGVRSCFPE